MKNVLWSTSSNYKCINSLPGWLEVSFECYRVMVSSFWRARRSFCRQSILLCTYSLFCYFACLFMRLGGWLEKFWIVNVKNLFRGNGKTVLGKRILEISWEKKKFAWVRESNWICTRIMQNVWNWHVEDISQILKRREEVWSIMKFQTLQLVYLNSCLYTGSFDLSLLNGLSLTEIISTTLLPNHFRDIFSTFFSCRCKIIYNGNYLLNGVSIDLVYVIYIDIIWKFDFIHPFFTDLSWIIFLGCWNWWVYLLVFLLCFT